MATKREKKRNPENEEWMKDAIVIPPNAFIIVQAKDPEAMAQMLEDLEALDEIGVTGLVVSHPLDITVLTDLELERIGLTRVKDVSRVEH